MIVNSISVIKKLTSSRASNRDIATSYAKILVAMAAKKVSLYDTDALNAMVLQLPFAEAHLAVNGQSQRSLPVLGEDVELRAYVMTKFLGFVQTGTGEAYNLTQPFRIRRRHLEALDAWEEWNTLGGYLATLGLSPYVMFRNTPITQHQDETYYVADLRFLFAEGFEYRWSDA